MNSVKDYIAKKYGQSQITDDEDDSPYDSIARSGAQIPEDDFTGQGEDSPAMPAPMPQAPMPQQASPMPASDPMADYDRQEAASRGIRDRAESRNDNLGVYRALGQLAGAGGTAPIQSGLYDQLAKNNDQSAKMASDDLARRNAVIKAIMAQKGAQAKAAAGNEFANKGLSLREKIAADHLAEQKRHNMAQESGDRDKANKPKEPKPFDQAQFQAGTFGKRAAESEAALNKLTDSGYDPYSAGETIKNSLSKVHLPIIGDIENPRLRTDKKSEMDAIKQNFVSAVLRKESGAAISADEYAMEERKYFPQPGDSDETKKFKAQARADAIAGLQAASGGAMGAPLQVLAKQPDPIEQAPRITPDLQMAAKAELERRRAARAQGLGQKPMNASFHK